MVWRNTSRLDRDLRLLSKAFKLWIGDDYDFVIVGGLKLPPGFDRALTELLLELPRDYPLSPPGVGDNQVYLPPTLRFQGRRLEDLHGHRTPDFETPGFGPWAWFCYEYVRWLPERDDLTKFVEMVRADLTNPKTKWSL